VKSPSATALTVGVLLAGLIGACTLTSAQAQRPSPGESSGKRIAERNCGGCHAVGPGRSLLADAPPFRTLHDRYPRGGLDQILEEGMLRPSRVPEEGSPPSHPRMPTADLGDDEVADLKAYLRSLDPRAPVPEPPGG